MTGAKKRARGQRSKKKKTKKGAKRAAQRGAPSRGKKAKRSRQRAESDNMDEEEDEGKEEEEEEEAGDKRRSARSRGTGRVNYCENRRGEGSDFESDSSETDNDDDEEYAANVVASASLFCYGRHRRTVPRFSVMADTAGQCLLTFLLWPTPQDSASLTSTGVCKKTVPLRHHCRPRR